MATFGALAIGVCVALPSAAAAATPAESVNVVFATGTARQLAGNLAVPVRCLGEPTDFCSGVLTLASGGHKVSVPFSVQGGSAESVFVPLRLERESRLRRVLGVAATAQPGGPPVKVTEVLSVG